MRKFRNNRFPVKGLLIALGITIIGLFVFVMNAEAGYDQTETDSEDDVIDRETKETTDEYPEIDILAIVTTDNGNGTVTSVTTYNDDVALSGKYVYYVNLSDGQEESEHYAEYFFVPDNGINLIQYQNGENEDETEDALVIDGATITATIELSKCGIPEADFTITTCMAYTYGSSPYLDIKHSDELGDPPVVEGYETVVEVVDNGEDDLENDIQVTVWYYEDESRREPVEGAQVSLYVAQMEGRELRNGTTDANGQLLLENFVPGDYMVRVVDDQYEDYNSTSYIEILIDDTPILKVRADEHDIDGDELYTDGKVWVYYGSLMEQPVLGAEVYMDGDYVGDTGAKGLEIEGPIAEGLHLIKAEYEGDVAYCSLNIETYMEENFSEKMHISLVQEDGDVDDDLENDIIVEFTDDNSSDPISGVDIYLDDELMGTTDANGTVIYKNLTEGYHEVTASYDGDDYFWYLLIGFNETHELGDFDFDGEENDMKFTAEVGGLSMPYSTFVLFEDIRNGMPEALGYTSFNGEGYVQDLEEDDYHGGIVNMIAGVVQLAEFNFSVGSVEETVTEPDEVDFGDGNVATVQAGVSGDVTLTNQVGSQPDAEDDDALGVYLEITMEGTGDLNWVNITIDYDDVPAGIDPAKLKMYYWDEGNEEWVIIENSGVDTVNKFVWANLTHLTLFAPRQEVGAGDPGAPVITHDPILTGYAGQPISSIFAEITDDDGVASAELYYRKSSDTEYTRYNMTIGMGGYYGKIPREAVTLDGVDYYIKASDGTNEAFDPGVDMYHYIEVTEATGNELPVGTFIRPLGGETFSGKIEINWTASDPDGDNLRFLLSISKDSGATWQPLYGSMGYYPTIVENFTFDTTDTENGVDTPDGSTYRFMLELFDDGDPALSSAVQTGDFTINVTLVKIAVTEPEEVDLGEENSATVVAGIGGDITLIAEAATQPDAEDPNALGLYLNVTIDGDGSLEWVNITIDYDDVPAGIDQAKLKMYYWDETTNKWDLIENSGVDTVNKFVWANVTHLTLFAPRQSEPAGDDTTPPAITHTAVKKADVDTKIKITATITDEGLGVQSATLHYRKTGETNYTKVDMTADGDTYSAEIPAKDVTKDGIEYYIKATDGTNTATAPSDSSNPYKIKVEEEEDDGGIIPGFEAVIALAAVAAGAGILVARKKRTR